jgi:D-alanyl-D-alanine carboxypeptidase/D-alanyl-D-alanine-endopeptidase (penicillin-binding protein 4)
MKRTSLVLAVILALAATAAGAAGSLAERINGIINNPSQKKVQFAVNIIKADTGQPVYSHDASKPMKPASNMKIITSSVATKRLGPDYEFKTEVGLIDNDLVIIGCGDPLLADKENDAKDGRQPGWLVETIVGKLKQMNIPSVDNIIVDTTVFDNQRVHPNWPPNDLNKWWACEICGLNFHDNSIEVIAANTGGKAVLNIEPKTAFVQITNEVQTISSGSGAIGAYRTQGSPNVLTIKGKCRNQEGPFEVAIEGPANFFVYVLSEKLLSAGITVKGQLIEKGVEINKNFKKVAEYKTPLTECLARCNKDSFGLVAESLLKTIASRSLGGKGGSWQVGQKVLSDYLASLGVNQSEFHIDDGSGLSRENRLSTNCLTAVLLDMYKSKDWPVYKDSLATAGTDGTIKKYFNEEPYKGRIFGKTGYISGVKSFSGICSTGRGDYIFSILTEGDSGQTRDAINDIVKALFE